MGTGDSRRSFKRTITAAHLAGADDGVVRVAPLLERVTDWRAYLLEPLEAAQEELWRQHERTGRPLGAPAFLDRVERVLGRRVRPLPAGRPKKTPEGEPKSKRKRK